MQPRHSDAVSKSGLLGPGKAQSLSRCPTYDHDIHLSGFNRERGFIVVLDAEGERQRHKSG